MRFSRTLPAIALLLLGLPTVAGCEDRDTPAPVVPVVTERPDPPRPDRADDHTVPDDPPEPEPEPQTESQSEPDGDCAYVGDYACDPGESPYGDGGPAGCAFPGDVACTVTVPGPLLPDW